MRHAIRMRALLLFVVIGAAAASAACWPWTTGPSRSVTGTWSARGAGHSTTFQLALTQEGDRISGVACEIEGDTLVFGGAPVSGDYPRMMWANGVFSGKYEQGRDQIAGDYGSTPLRFDRSATGRCEGAK